MVTGLMSLWTAPYLKTFGGLPEEFMMLWGLSMAAARKHFERIILVTDVIGSKLLENLPYDAVYLDLDGYFLPERAQSVWAAGKFLGFSRAINEGRPFASFDGDVILRKSQRVFDAPIFAQSEEDFTMTKSGNKKEDNLRNIYMNGGAKKLPYLPAFMRFSLTRESHRPFNMGICGGSDLEFWEEFVDYAMEILRHDANQAILPQLNPTLASLLIEQYLMGALAEKRGKYVATLFPNSADQNESLMTSLGYTHLLGDSKTKPDIIAAVYKTCEQRFPWMFNLVKAMNLRQHLKDGTYYRSGCYYYSS